MLHIKPLLKRSTAWFLLCLVFAFQTWAEDKRISLKYPVSKISFRYGQDSPDLPNLNILRDVSVSLSGSKEDIVLDRLIRGATPLLELDDQDLYKLAEIPVYLLKDSGFEGVLAFPNPQMIDPVSGQDLRGAGDHALEIVIWCSMLDEVIVAGEGLLPRERELLQERIANFVSQENLDGEPIRRGFLEYVSDLVEHPSRHSRVVLSAGSEPGKVRAVVQANRVKRPKFSISASNSGSEATGDWLFNFSARTDQLTGRDDRAQLNYSLSNTGERNSLSGAYYIPLVHPEFTSLGIGMGYSSYDASTYAVTRVDFEGDNLYLDLSMSGVPNLYLGEDISPHFEAGLKLENVSAFNSLFGRSTDVTMFTPRVSFSLESKGDYRIGNSMASLFGNMSSISERNMEILGGYLTTDRYARLQLSHTETFFLGKWIEDTFSTAPSEYFSRQLFSIRGQLDFSMSGKRHLPHHQFIAGGTGSVRGYPEAPVAGDSGVLLSLEYQVPFYFFNDTHTGEDLPWTISAFLDWARVGVKDPLFFESDQTLSGMGVGVQILLPRGLYARFDLAKPLRELKAGNYLIEGTQSSDYRVHGNIGWNF